MTLTHNATCLRATQVIQNRPDRYGLTSSIKWIRRVMEQLTET